MFNKVLFSLLITLCVALLLLWRVGPPKVAIAPRLPIPENQGKPKAPKAEEASNPGTLVHSSGTPSADTGSWPQFRGADRRNIAAGFSIPDTWPAGGPPVLWKLPVGEGHAGPAIHKGRVFLLDYDEAKKEDVVRCLSLADGKDIWRYSYTSKVKRNHGMSRTTPAVSDRFLVTLGPNAHVHCLHPETGSLYWKKDLVAEYGTQVPEWYAGQCPLIDGDHVLLAPGGKCLLTAIDLATGNTVWETPNPKGWKMSHSSIAPAEFEGEKEYLWCSAEGAVAVSAKDGALLWDLPEWRIRIATVPSPADLGQGRILFSGGYGAGALAVKQVRKDGKIELETLYRTEPDVFGADQHTPILVDGLIYAVIPGGKLTCLTPEGKVHWSLADLNFGLGPFLFVDGKLLIQDDDHDSPGALCLYRVDAKGASQLASAKILEGHEAWGPMAFADGKLILRDSKTLVCIDLTKPGGPPSS
ncbi:MAG: hypothetical protein GHCLOJNM_01141 [bacterium]|nr:hypothetical protein [bacterium]